MYQALYLERNHINVFLKLKFMYQMALESFSFKRRMLHGTCMMHI